MLRIANLIALSLMFGMIIALTSSVLNLGFFGVIVLGLLTGFFVIPIMIDGNPEL